MDKMNLHTPLIVGCGAIGSQVVRQLAHMGSNLTMCDFDIVSIENMCCQGFLNEDMGIEKVYALAEAVREINPAIDVTSIAKPFSPEELYEIPTVVFCCVEDMAVRAELFKITRRYANFFVDGRMKGGDTIRIIQARSDDPESFNAYVDTLFPDSEASEGTCTSKTTIYGAYIAAGMMVAEYAKWLRWPRVYRRDYTMSLPSNELFINVPELPTGVE